jgi:hypothetical protein
MIRHVNELLRMNPRKVFLFVMMFVLVVVTLGSYKYGSDILTLVGERLGTPHQLVEVRDRLEIDRQVLGSLGELRANTNADRVAVYLFHNGKMSVNDIPFLFYSQTHETVRRGVSRDLLASQGMPLSTIAAWSERLIDNRCFIDEVSLIEDEVLASLLFDRGVQQVAVCPLATTRGMPFGFLTVQWTTSDIPQQHTQALQEARAAAVTMALSLNRRTNSILNTQDTVTDEAPAS